VRDMNRKRRDGQKLASYIMALPPGEELDRLIASLVFGRKIEECPCSPTGFHVIGADHFTSNLRGEDFCGHPLPKFSTDWEHCQGLLEWMSAHYGSVQIFWDCDHWACNLNEQEDGQWFRLSSIPRTQGFQEALCKAALLAKVNPMDLPLELKFTVKAPKAEKKKTKPKKRRKKRGT
jgi:hypothetical protein